MTRAAALRADVRRREADAVSEDKESTIDASTRFNVNRRTFVGASVAIGGAVATVSLLPGCSDDASQDDAQSAVVRLRINGEERDITVDNRTSLLDMLRERAELPGGATNPRATSPRTCPSRPAASPGALLRAPPVRTRRLPDATGPRPRRLADHGQRRIRSPELREHAARPLHSERRRRPGVTSDWPAPRTGHGHRWTHDRRR
ncbi:MAG: xanthine dehydrogenase YagT iron-sulfur-binding subunit [Mycobacterium sp.]|nr:xanthine dehydrogenase YagT iron-sulfur-binding subunit [Mycobacterium sp.]